MYRFGITMRVTEASSYNESRDSIAIDWAQYIESNFLDPTYVFLPNIEHNIIRYLKQFKVNVIILSGGDELDPNCRRYKTEHALIKYALKNDIPIIAVCRGMQQILNYFGGSIKKGDNSFISRHRSTRHLVNIDGSKRIVNSYHNNEVDESSISKKFNIYARCKIDNTVEGLRNNQVLAMMWHPEREKKSQSWNKELIVDFLENREK